jgi:hypothetical protein
VGHRVRRQKIAPKRLQLLHELLPSEKIMGLMVNTTDPVAQTVLAEAKSTAVTLGIEIRGRSVLAVVTLSQTLPS